MKTARNPNTKYLFYIETRDALTDQQEYIEWRGLTYKQARDMYAYTDAHQPSNVTGYGWEEIKPAPTPETLTQNS